MSGEVGVDFSAVVTDIRLESRDGAAVRWRMTLDRTEFAAGDVGVLHAVSRGGTRIQVPVLAVVRTRRATCGMWWRSRWPPVPMWWVESPAERGLLRG